MSKIFFRCVQNNAKYSVQRVAFLRGTQCQFFSFATRKIIRYVSFCVSFMLPGVFPLAFPFVFPFVFRFMFPFMFPFVFRNIQYVSYDWYVYNRKEND